MPEQTQRSREQTIKGLQLVTEDLEAEMQKPEYRSFKIVHCPDHPKGHEALELSLSYHYPKATALGEHTFEGVDLQFKSLKYLRKEKGRVWRRYKNY